MRKQSLSLRRGNKVKKISIRLIKEAILASLHTYRLFKFSKYIGRGNNEIDKYLCSNSIKMLLEIINSSLYAVIFPKRLKKSKKLFHTKVCPMSADLNGIVRIY